MACHAGARGLGASAELPLNGDILSPQLAALAIAVLQYCLCAGDTVPVDPPPPPTRLTRPARALSSPHAARDNAPLSSAQPVCSPPAASAPTTSACLPACLPACIAPAPAAASPHRAAHTTARCCTTSCRLAQIASKLAVPVASPAPGPRSLCRLPSCRRILSLQSSDMRVAPPPAHPIVRP